MQCTTMTFGLKTTSYEGREPIRRQQTDYNSTSQRNVEARPITEGQSTPITQDGQSANEHYITWFLRTNQRARKTTRAAEDQSQKAYVLNETPPQRRQWTNQLITWPNLQLFGFNTTRCMQTTTNQNKVAYYMNLVPQGQATLDWPIPKDDHALSQDGP